MKITNDIFYIGVNVHEVDLYEGQYIVPDGMAYNSYIIMDEKIAVTDTVDSDFIGQWFENMDEALQGKSPDYLIVHHMEPDHSAGIKAFCEKYPENDFTYDIIGNGYNNEIEDFSKLIENIKLSKRINLLVANSHI